MLIMKNLKINITTVAIAALFVASGCKDANKNNDLTSLTEADQQSAVTIMSESLSDQSNGFVSNLYDATASVGDNEISFGDPMYKGQFAEGRHDSAGRGHEVNFSHTYNSLTGIHSISFVRTINNSHRTSSLTADMTYLFQDTDGNAMARPRENKSAIHSIDFTSTKSGESESLSMSHNFTRVDTMSFVGVDSASATFQFSGKHNGTGEITMTNPRNGDTFSRKHEVYYQFDQVSIDKELVRQNHNLEEGVTGSMSYNIVLNRTLKDGTTDEKVVEGTIEFNGDGTALMKFKDFAQKYVINLISGETLN